MKGVKKAVKGGVVRQDVAVCKLVQHHIEHCERNDRQMTVGCGATVKHTQRPAQTQEFTLIEGKEGAFTAFGAQPYRNQLSLRNPIR